MEDDFGGELGPCDVGGEEKAAGPKLVVFRNEVDGEVETFSHFERGK